MDDKLPGNVPYAAGFASQWSEINAEDLPVEGKIPRWLSGCLIRNGPGACDSEDGNIKVSHWFDGLAMLHRFGFDAGQVSYGNRFLRSDCYAQWQALKETGEQREIGGFARDPCRALFGKAMAVFEPTAAGNASVHVHPLDDEMIALTETPLAVQFDPDTLDTLGFHPISSGADGLGVNHGTAHPYLDPDTGELIFYGLAFGQESHYLFSRVNGDLDSPKLIAKIKTDKPAYLHSFGCTKEHIILAEWPIRTTALTMLMARQTNGGFMNAFKAENIPTQFHLIERATGKVTGVCEAPPMFGFHHVNAYTDGDRIICDVSAYDSVDVLGGLTMQHLRHGTGDLGRGARLARFELPLAGGQATETVLYDGMFELPRVRDDLCGKQHRFAYGLSQPGEQAGEFLDRIVKIDTQGEAKTWHQPGCFPGEPVFVPEPGDDAIGEDDGVILSVVLDSEKNQSFVLVLDAVDLSEIGRAYAPQVVPFGFHGRYLGA